MNYRDAAEEDIAFFKEHGYLVVEDVIDLHDVGALIERCDEVLEKREEYAHDWAWEKGTPLDQRSFKIVQANISLTWPDFLPHARFREWAVAFASALMGRPMEFWYDQFLAKSPHSNAATPWHQDEGYWGRKLDDAGITCWLPFQDVDPSNGCMHFIDGGQLDGILEHHRPENIQSDMLVCKPDEKRSVACPLRVGGVTFHHSKTPHMTSGNTTDGWRKIITQHLKQVGVEGEGDHYPWRVFVDQTTGEERAPAGEDDKDTRWDRGKTDA